ncbi:uncharacterized protein LOC143229104 isoform X2 [Tachypleus tridentatus]|uniref:uncharacterized protein LOC143229104 isoform X2 n=1 Tax=Tachypleus tridentatus TaxID=6853 RepID=UPI003FCEFBFA
MPLQDMENSNSFDRSSIKFSPSQYPLPEKNSICSNEDTGSGIPFWYFNAIPNEEPCCGPSSGDNRISTSCKLCTQVSTCFDQEHNISLRNSKVTCDSNFTSPSTSQNGRDTSGHPILYQVEEELFTAVPNYQLASDDFDKSRKDAFEVSIRKEPMGSDNKDISLSVMTTLHSSNDLNGESHHLIFSSNSKEPQCVILPVSSVKENEQGLYQQVNKDSMSFHHPLPSMIGQSFDVSSGGSCSENNDYYNKGVSESEVSNQSCRQSESSGEDQDTLSQRVEALLGEKIIYTQSSEESYQLNDSSNDNGNEKSTLQEQTNSDKSIMTQEVNQLQNRDFIFSNQMSVNSGDSEIKTNYSKSNLTELPIKGNEIKLLKTDTSYFPNCDFPYSNDATHFQFFPTVNLGQKTAEKKLEDGCQSNTDLEERGILGTGEERMLSPLSVCSATSSRRLEWDSGADIGYPVSPACCRSEPEGYFPIFTDKILVINKREKGIQTVINEDNSLEDNLSVSGESVSSECILESLYDKQCFTSPCDLSNKEMERKQLIDKVHHILQSSRAKRLKAQETNNLLGRTLVSRTENNVRVLKNQNCVADNGHGDDSSTPDCSVYSDLEVLKITNSLSSLNMRVGDISSRTVSSQPLVTWIYTNPSLNCPQVSVTHNNAPLSCIKDLFGGETKETSVVKETNYHLCDSKFTRDNDSNCNDKVFLSNKLSVCHDSQGIGTLCRNSQINLSSVLGCNNKETEDIQQNEEGKNFQIQTNPAGSISLLEVHVKDVSGYNVQPCNGSQWENTPSTLVRNKTNENPVSMYSIFSHSINPVIQDLNQSPGENQEKNLLVKHSDGRLVDKSITDQQKQLKQVVNADKQNVEKSRAFQLLPYNTNFSQKEHFANSHCLENTGREQVLKFKDSETREMRTENRLAPINGSALLVLGNSKVLNSDLKEKDSEGFERDAEKSLFATKILISSHLPELMKPNVSEAQTSKLFQVIKTDTTMVEGSCCATEVRTRIKSPLKYSSQLPSVEKTLSVFYPVGTPADQHKINDASLLLNSHAYDLDKDSNSVGKHISTFSTKCVDLKQHFKLPSVQCVSKDDQCFSSCRTIPVESNQCSMQIMIKDIPPSANHEITKKSKSCDTFSECANANEGQKDNHKELLNEIHVPSFETQIFPSTLSMNTYQRSPTSINTDLKQNHQNILATFKSEKVVVSEMCQVCGFKSRSMIRRQKQPPNRLSTEQPPEISLSHTPLYVQSASRESLLSARSKCSSCIFAVTDTLLTDDPTICSEMLQNKLSCKQLPQWEKHHKYYNVPSAWHLSGSLENLSKKSQTELERSNTTIHQSFEHLDAVSPTLPKEKEVMNSRAETPVEQLGVNSYMSISHSKNSIAQPSKNVLSSDETSTSLSERKCVKAPWKECLNKLNTLNDYGEMPTSAKQSSSGEERYDEDFRRKNVEGGVGSERKNIQKINSCKDHTSLRKEGKKTVLQAHQQSRTKSSLHSAQQQKLVYPVKRKRETAKKELEKLKHLVDRQKKSYLHRLQREVERLERLEKLFQESSPTDDEKTSTVYTKVQEISENWSSAKGTTSSTNSSFCTIKTKTLSKHADLSSLYDHYPAHKFKRKVLHSAGVQETQKYRMDEKGELSNCQSSKFTYRRNHIEKTSPELVSVCVQTQVEPQEGINKYERQFVSTGLLSSFERKKFAGQKGKIYRNQRLNSAKNTLRKMIPPSVSWFVPVTVSVRRNNQSGALHKHFQETGRITLQDAFNKHCSHVIKNSQERLQHVRSLAEFRKHHSAKYVKNGLICHKQRSHRIGKTYKDNHQQKRKIFSHWEMRQQTEKVYQKLPEVLKKSENARRAQEYKNNQLKLLIYNQKQKERVLKGKVSLPITQQCCLSSVHQLPKQPAQ